MRQPTPLERNVGSDKAMKPQVKVLVFVCVSAALIGGYFWIDRPFRESMKSNYEFKRMHTAPGTLKSISGPANKSSVEGGDMRTYTVCFTLDSFSDLTRDLQQEYAEAERSRMTRDGPRCIQARDRRSVEGTPGEAIQVNYLIDGQGAITVERLVIQGQQLSAL
jgi:hypothetical protein